MLKNFLSNEQVLLLNLLREEMLKYFISDEFEDYSHGISHTDRVLRLVGILNKGEGGDLLVLSISALLHDMARAQEEKGQCVDHASRGGELAEVILLKYNISDDIIKQVVYCIQNHSFDKKGKTIESKILRDADKLDSLGAIAISRVIASTFQSKKYKRPMFDPEIADNGHEAASAIHYLTLIIERYEKGDYFITKTAKTMAKERVGVMKVFVESFKKEWFLDEN